MKTFVVLAEHPIVPGIVVKVRSTQELATKAAVELTDIMWHDAGKKTKTNASNWEKRLELLQDDYGAAHCYVEIHEREIDDAA